ncbi:alpha/beta hydrolase [Mucilaginibacter psychrotolerans]|uniref:Alpha/beta hydrolase n=1 Tax=Mucilaginibacter psychrotolerans TaxID=1524096 RepID=A0A4Y8SGX7_9SPHI|nr:alpha/beta hydrolase-fold protein [Mucilaginibacter psychrotolerans]TFF37895.1 alpha/beta hydrolase [Mucilaginibacter psychrotolerans]
MVRQLLIIALFTVCAQSLRAQNADTARVVISQVSMPQLGRGRTIRVFLPAGYVSSKKKYPVIYMHDGQNLFTGNTSFAGSWLVDSTLKTFPADKQAIVVGIDNSGQYRMAEYNAYTSKYAPKPDGDAYLAFIVNTLKPHIDSLYHTKKDAKHTAIAGSSMGGLISMYAAVKYPEVFGVAGVFSPSFWIAPQMYPLTTDAKLNRKQRYFLACGDQEGDETVYVNKMDSILIAKGFNRKKVPAPLILKGAKHNEAQWKLAFKVFYRWFTD